MNPRPIFRAWWSPPQDGTSHFFSAVEHPGKSADEVLSLFGPPVVDNVFGIGEAGIGEREELLGYYPREFRENRYVRFREMIWHLPDEGVLWLFFHQVDGTWVVLHSYRRPKNWR